ncbi:hypothetical protein [Streptomyces sp. V1I1]|uniref:hypothetical protein n=1 Tax=Streptomyces sp. V1I1 TaxID=3042272 RepID=UPI00278777BE|nr:hypothetical protein [Streptomyces sp. V1I1]MDQ0939116.1 hypothetical protein [Streptomyces sp. V1I1]
MGGPPVEVALVGDMFTQMRAVLQRLAAPPRVVLALALAAVTVAAGSLLGGHTMLLLWPCCCSWPP